MKRTPNRAQRASVDRIVEIVAAKCGIPARAIQGRSQLPAVTMARHIAMSLAAREATLGLVEIGGYFDRDHTTVRHGIARIRSRADLTALADMLARDLGLVTREAA